MLSILPLPSEKAAEFTSDLKIQIYSTQTKETERRQVLLKHVEQGGDKGKGQVVQGHIDLEPTFLFCFEYSGMPLEVLKLESDSI